MKSELVDVNWRLVGEEIIIPADRQVTLNAAMAKLETHHLPTAQHCKRVGIMASRIGKYVDLPTKPLFYGGSLHDLGKLNVAPELLDKTGEWTALDAAALENHPTDGYSMLVKEGMIITAGLVVRHHTFQKNAYPQNTPKSPSFGTCDFLRCARIIALADFYDAAHRPNSSGLATEGEIEAKLLDHNPDVAPLIIELYDEGIFGQTTT